MTKFDDLVWILSMPVFTDINVTVHKIADVQHRWLTAQRQILDVKHAENIKRVKKYYQIPCRRDSLQS